VGSGVAQSCLLRAGPYELCYERGAFADRGDVRGGLRRGAHCSGQVVRGGTGPIYWGKVALPTASHLGLMGAPRSASRRDQISVTVSYWYARNAHGAGLETLRLVQEKQITSTSRKCSSYRALARTCLRSAAVAHGFRFSPTGLRKCRCSSIGCDLRTSLLTVKIA